MAEKKPYKVQAAIKFSGIVKIIAHFHIDQDN